ncbi:MAG: hypothetical protein KDJ36_15280 [Hyphomicrobiaceae bacterium]|nr:hypothetical protein [Hyphomicrobiaceae bacterium]
MILEQAFHSMPEILTGYGFPSQEYEGGIVGAYSLAILQELNGRNVNNPIAAMQLEKPFRDRSKPIIAKDDKTKRYLRCDLHLSGIPVRIGSAALSHYGWRHSNWVEAKFFRAFTKDGKPRKSTNQAVNTAHLLADLIRLMTLVPVRRGKKDGLSFAGRYLLHVYLTQFEDHLSVSRREDGQDVERPWLGTITTPGRWEVEGESVGYEPDSVLSKLGRELRELSFDLTVTNFVQEPIVDASPSRQFMCYLTRIDAFTIRHNDIWWSLGADREIVESRDGAADEIARFVGRYIGLTTERDTQKPTPEEEEAEDSDRSDKEIEEPMEGENG